MKEAFRVEHILIDKFGDYSETCDTEHYRNLGIDIELDGRIVIILGNSGTGKSYMAGRFIELKDDAIALKDHRILNDVKVLESMDSVTVWVQRLGDEEHKGKVAIIDNADIIGLMGNPEYKKAIENDSENQYILMIHNRETSEIKNECGCSAETPYNLAELVIKDNKMQLLYK